MHPFELETQLINWTVRNSGIEVRNYLGMSAIGHCPRYLYYLMLGGREHNIQSHHYCYLGYLFERDILNRLEQLGREVNGRDAPILKSGREFVDFAGRFQGHTDGEWDGDLLEIKSVRHDRLPGENGRLPRTHFWQIQTYMHYGSYRLARVVYVARDTGHIRVVGLRRNEKIGELARLKAATVLEAVDRRRPPPCECGHCKTVTDKE